MKINNFFYKYFQKKKKNVSTNKEINFNTKPYVTFNDSMTTTFKRCTQFIIFTLKTHLKFVKSFDY